MYLFVKLLCKETCTERTVLGFFEIVRF